MSTSRRLVHGSALRVITLIVGMAVSFYVMPFLVRTLGDRWYGFWALAGSLVGYYVLLDLGLSAAAHRFLAIAHARNDEEETNRVFTTGLYLFAAAGGIALLLTAAIWTAVPWFVVAEDVQTIRRLVALLGINFSMGFPTTMYHGILAATVRYDLSSYLQLARILVRTVLVVLALRQVPSVVVLAAITLAVDVANNLTTIAVARRLWPSITVARRYFDRSRVSEFFQFGIYAFLIRVGDLVRFGVDGFIVAAFLSVATVTHYGIAISLVEYYITAMSHAIGVLTPVFSRYHGSASHDELVYRVRQALRLAVALSAPIAGGLIIFGSPFIRRWMGPEYLDAYVPLVILVSVTLLGVMQIPSTTFLLAIGKHRYYAWLNGADALANLALSVILVPRLGLIGVAIGTAIPALFVKLYFQPRYTCRQMGIPLSKYWTEVGGMLVRTVLLQVPIAVIVWFVQPRSYLGIFGLGGLLYAIYAAVLYMFVMLEEDQLALAKAVPQLEKLRALRQRLSPRPEPTIR